ncbi:hypothetical protein KO512_02320 [Amphritea atlantica]|nr:hypothetical protein [Amphritea atlantica]
MSFANRTGIETNDVVDNRHRWCGSSFTAPYLSVVMLGLLACEPHHSYRLTAHYV